MDQSHISQNIHLSLQYPVYFTHDVFSSGHMLLPELFSSLDSQVAKRDVLVVIDGGLTKERPGLASEVTAYWQSSSGLPSLAAQPLVVPGGEAIKNDYRKLMEVVDVMLEHRLCRHSFVLIIGGGAVLDAVGFAASIVHRGLRVIRLPSTTLAQNDAGVGVKTGMNLHGGKNTIGTFQAPVAVINDLSLLKSLPDRHWRDGISEAFKVAMIKDADFFHWLCANASVLRNRDMSAMEVLVKRCAALHLDHIAQGGDPFETGNARPLDFGHWSAHKLESMTAYEVSHGEAVGVGLLIDSAYAVSQGWLDGSVFESLYQGISDSGLSTWHDALNRLGPDGGRQVVDGLEEFREHLGGELCLTFPQGLGSSHQVHALDMKVLNECLDELSTRVGADAARR